MDLYMLSLCTLVPERPSCVFYATRCPVYWGLTHDLAFCLYSDLIPHTHTHTHTHTHKDTQRHTAPWGGNRLTHPSKYILTLPAMCSQQLSVVHWIIHWFQKLTFHNIFSFQTLHTGRSRIFSD